ncbi:FadR/GntR family transcriptional regulator [Lichenicoccus roseus]|uniref:FadR/GntR family transcriptional regulator n=1 Tax=Lichenicoccus roseus TaxID=2683649 RepID=UPI001F0F7EEB|nr:FadR/GntR family transcriptional regulator [Lichenicoccus roseus]
MSDRPETQVNGLQPAVRLRRAKAAPRTLERLHTAIARDLGVAIAAGVLSPGDTLSGEVASSAQLAVSRTAYREAVRILAAKGLVESRTRTGTRVSARHRWHILDPEVLGWFLQTHPSEAFVRDLFEVRMMVEPAAAAFAAERASPHDLRTMAAALDEMDRLKLSTEAGRAADRAFHHAILAATRNEAIMALSSSVGAAIRWTTLFKHRTQTAPRDPIVEHRLVLDAIAARDPEAARTSMTALVRYALADMQASLAAGAGNGAPVADAAGVGHKRTDFILSDK